MAAMDTNSSYTTRYDHVLVSALRTLIFPEGIDERLLSSGLFSGKKAQLRFSTFEPLSVTLQKPLPMGQPFVYLTGVDLKGTGFGSHTFNFEFSNGGENDAVILGVRGGFHSVARGLLVPSAQLEKAGLLVPDSADVSLSYEVPFRMWHGLPDGLFKYLNRIAIVADKLTTRWPSSQVGESALDKRYLAFFAQDVLLEQTPYLALFQHLYEKGFVNETPLGGDNLATNSVSLRADANRKLFGSIEDRLSDLGEKGSPKRTTTLSFKGDMPVSTLLEIPDTYQAHLSRAHITYGTLDLYRTNEGVFIAARDLETAARVSDVVSVSSVEVGSANSKINSRHSLLGRDTKRE